MAILPRARRALIAVALASTGCATDVSTHDAHRLVYDGARLLDVRTREEYAERHARGAMNIPIAELRKRMSELAPRDRPVVVYCHTGVRAGIAAIQLRRAGFTRVYNVGTIARWFREQSGTWPLY
jgi:rhodanese-related sulfurtransferase